MTPRQLKQFVKQYADGHLRGEHSWDSLLLLFGRALLAYEHRLNAAAGCLPLHTGPDERPSKEGGSTDPFGIKHEGPSMWRPL